MMGWKGGLGEEKKNNKVEKGKRLGLGY